MSFGDLAKYGGLYSGESGSLKSIEVLITICTVGVLSVI